MLHYILHIYSVGKKLHIYSVGKIAEKVCRSVFLTMLLKVSVYML